MSIEKNTTTALLSNLMMTGISLLISTLYTIMEKRSRY
jgi:hypothetical protein